VLPIFLFSFFYGSSPYRVVDFRSAAPWLVTKALSQDVMLLSLRWSPKSHPAGTKIDSIRF